MFYSLLGRVVWIAAKWYVRRRYAWLRPSRPALAGGVLALVLTALVIGQRNHMD